jgi:hypothetical protein
MKMKSWLILAILAMFVSAEIAAAQNQLKVVGVVNLAGRKAGGATKDFSKLGSGKYIAKFEGISGSAKPAQTNTYTATTAISFPKVTIGPICVDAVASLTVGNDQLSGPAISAFAGFCPEPSILGSSSGIVVGGRDYGIFSVRGVNRFLGPVVMEDNANVTGNVSAKEFVCVGDNGNIKLAELVKQLQAKIQILENEVAELKKNSP